MKNQIITTKFNITTDPHFQDERFGITPELSKKLAVLVQECQNKENKKIIEKLTQFILQYPSVPHLKNFLSVAYNAQGKYEKAKEVNNWIQAEHPDYLFGRLNLANICIENGEFDRVPEILGELLEIKSLYPERDLFHFGEITGYYKVIIRYYAAIENLELAENRLSILQEIAPGHRDTEEAESFLWHLRLERAAARLEEESKNRIIPSYKSIVPVTNNSTAPVFNHKEIECLYQHGIDIPHNKLIEILALPRNTVIKDLEKTLVDAVERYGYFKGLEYEESTLSFVLHSIFLLKELNAEDSLHKILAFLELDADFLDFWLSDHKTDTLWQAIYGLGISNTPALKHFLMQPGIDTYSKNAVSEALCQMVLHRPEKRAEVLTVFSDVFTQSVNATLEDNIIASDFLALAICDVLDCNLQELLPVIKILFDKQRVASGISGDFNSIERDFNSPDRPDFRKDLFNIFDLYDNVLETWDGYNDPLYDEEYDEDFSDPIPFQQAVSDKIGRNEPCPCGSGKKYKKCCLIKELNN